MNKMKSYNWWLKQKRRVKKKYHLMAGEYYSPKELKIWYRKWKENKKRNT